MSDGRASSNQARAVNVAGFARAAALGRVLAFGATGVVACGHGAKGDVPSPAADVDTTTRDAVDESVTTRATVREHADEVVAYTLRAKLDATAHTVHGEGTIVWRNASDKPVSDLWVHLYLNAFKNQSSDFLRAPIGGFRGSTVPKDWGAIDVRRFALRDGDAVTDLWPKAETKREGSNDETDARVPLPRPVAPGERITIEMEWDDKLPTIVERTGYDGSFHMIAQWFPKIAKLERDGTFAHFPFHHLGEFYADFGTFDVTVDVPSSFVVGATGPRVSSSVEGGRRIERHVQGDIHDFAWTAWDAFEERRERMGDVDVTILYPRGGGADAERELAAMHFAFPHFAERYGAYPYPVLTLVHPPTSATEAGGMEYPTLITTGSSGAVWTPRGVHLLELTTLHEFGHQYFYGLVASNEDRWPFLDEGLNSFAEAEAMETWKGPGSLVDMFGLKVGDFEGHAESARHVGHDEPIARSAEAFASGRTYGGLVYSRTATLLETVRRVYGREAFARAIGAYAREFRFEHPTPSDFLAVMRRELGERVARTMQIALESEGWVDFAVTSMSSHAAHSPWGIFDVGGRRETIAQAGTDGYAGWVLVVRRGTLSFPVDIDLVAEDGSIRRVPWDGVGDSVRVPYNGKSPLRAVVVDPEHRVLLDEKPENNFATAAGRTKAGAPRTLERAAYWAELLLGWIAP